MKLNTDGYMEGGKKKKQAETCEEGSSKIEKGTGLQGFIGT